LQNPEKFKPDKIWQNLISKVMAEKCCFADDDDDDSCDKFATVLKHTLASYCNLLQM
jgi:hypothetical protein